VVSDLRLERNVGLVPQFPQRTYAWVNANYGRMTTIRSTDGEHLWRVVAYPLQQDGAFVQVALPLEDVEKATARLRLLVVLFGLMVTVACAVLGWLAIRRAFAPLTGVEKTAAAIAAGDLSRRVPPYPPTTEVGRLTSALNGMLAQIEAAFRARQASENRTRRFAADASHELRTPLAAIRGYAELYRQGAVRGEADVARTMSRIEDEARRMGVLVEDLLLLARLDEQRPARTDPVDLAVLAGDAVHDARGLAPDRTVRLVGVLPGRGPEPSVVTGDENRLRQVVANLLANAVRHTPAGSPIEVAVGREGPLAVLEVRDHGPGIPPDHAEKVFERFYRVDSSRARGQGGGSGLGLSIVAAVAAAHGGRVGVAPTPGGGATFRLELPAAPDAPDDAPEHDGPDESGSAPTVPVRSGG
jgi:two-component system, OmpR family, sensor kinase